MSRFVTTASGGGGGSCSLPSCSTSAREDSALTVTCGREPVSFIPTFDKGAEAASHQHPEPPQKPVPRLEHSSSPLRAADISGNEVPNQIRCSEMIMAVLRIARASHSGFGEFCRRSLQPLRHQDGSTKGVDLWPCPPPRWHWTASARLSPRRRKRKRLLAAQAACLQHVVVSLHWLALGCPVSPPPAARLGGRISEAQHQMLETLEDLGRSADKLANLCKVSFNLDGIDGVKDQEIASFLHEVSKHVDPYSSGFHRRVSKHDTHNHEPAWTEGCLCSLCSRRAAQSSFARPCSLGQYCFQTCGC